MRSGTLSPICFKCCSSWRRVILPAVTCCAWRDRTDLHAPADPPHDSAGIHQSITTSYLTTHGTRPDLPFRLQQVPKARWRPF